MDKTTEAYMSMLHDRATEADNLLKENVIVAGPDDSRYQVIKFSKDYSEVSKFDINKQCQYMIEMNTASPNTTWVAVKTMAGHTKVFPYGNDGVTVITGVPKRSDHARVDERILNAYGAVISNSTDDTTITESIKTTEDAYKDFARGADEIIAALKSEFEKASKGWADITYIREKLRNLSNRTNRLEDNLKALK